MKSRLISLHFPYWCLWLHRKVDVDGNDVDESVPVKDQSDRFPGKCLYAWGLFSTDMSVNALCRLWIPGSVSAESRKWAIAAGGHHIPPIWWGKGLHCCRNYSVLLRVLLSCVSQLCKRVFLPAELGTVGLGLYGRLVFVFFCFHYSGVRRGNVFDRVCL